MAPAVSRSQQRFMAMVMKHKKGKMPHASEMVKKAAHSMSEKAAKDFASTKRKGLPNRAILSSMKKRLKKNTA
mgnify:CR=1 FL=1